MNFSCDRCGKRFTTSDDPVPGRTYRIPCACGNDVVLAVPAAGTEERRAPSPRSAPTPRPRSLGARPPRRGGDPFAPPAASEPLPDDPFAAAPVPDVPRREPVVPPSLDVTPTMDGPLARRDPDAPADESAEYRVTSALSFDDVLRRARRRGFLAGAVVGAVAAVAIAVGLAVATSRTSPAPHGPAPASASAEAHAPAGLPSTPVESSAPSFASGAPASPVPDTGTAAIAAPDARRGAAPGNAAAATPPSRPARPVPDTAADEPNPTLDAKSVVPDTERRMVPESEGGEVGGGAVPDTEGADGEARADVAGEVASSGPAPEGDRAEDERGGGEAVGQEGDAGAAADEPADPAEAPREAEVKAALAARQEALDECIALAPGEPAAARGQRFRLVVSVEPTGAVGEARVDDAEIARTSLGVCLVEIARTLRFPAFGGEPARVEVRVRHGVAE
jgi:hypothetical protein